MSYMLLIVEEPGQRTERTREEAEHVFQRMLDYSDALERQGVLVTSNSLRSDATRLKRREGRVDLIDGPFAETKELVGGFFLLNVKTYDEALACARECPAAEWASIEIRGVGPCYT
ncbi:MAG TPA: YciI family protein [Steroidobacteraceae bacterium]|jgi:hypothetical protein